MSHFVYMVKCSDNTLYTGYTIDVEKRLTEHNGDDSGKVVKSAGAKYTRGRRPVVLIHSESFETRSEALKREFAIKQLSRSEKLKLVQFNNKES